MALALFYLHRPVGKKSTSRNTMHFEENEVYHLYNRGNDKQRIFFQERNYEFFLQKVKEEWLKYCEILNYCLMPNHFHFLIVSNAFACETIKINNNQSCLQRF